MRKKSNTKPQVGFKYKVSAGVRIDGIKAEGYYQIEEVTTTKKGDNYDVVHMVKDADVDYFSSDIEYLKAFSDYPKQLEITSVKSYSRIVNGRKIKVKAYNRNK